VANIHKVGGIGLGRHVFTFMSEEVVVEEEPRDETAGPKLKRGGKPQ